MQKSARNLILRVIAIILYIYLVGQGLRSIIIYHNYGILTDFEGILLLGEMIMFVGLLRHNNTMISIALVLLSTGNWLIAVRYIRLLFLEGVNVLTLLLVLYHLTYAFTFAYILYVHIIHPENRLKSAGLMVMAHVMLFGFRFLYVSVFRSVIYGVLPVNLLPEHFLADRAMSGIIIGLRATLFDGLLAVFED